jgi:histidyl-tRNA synthetase
VVCSSEASKLPRQFRLADRMGIKVTLVLGPDEAAQGKVTIKNLSNGTQETIERTAIPGAVKRILSRIN